MRQTICCATRELTSLRHQEAGLKPETTPPLETETDAPSKTETAAPPKTETAPLPGAFRAGPGTHTGEAPGAPPEPPSRAQASYATDELRPGRLVAICLIGTFAKLPWSSLNPGVPTGPPLQKRFETAATELSTTPPRPRFVNA